ncbi:MAG: radical SAM protein [Candidatus Omnitrophica bacterium]|nr:radical SAM protein [Candidatus Omnitrophota bacterium]MDD5574991.1 radical SAM protein [Candidatus Omnitrophota bacterium]
MGISKAIWERCKTKELKRLSETATSFGLGPKNLVFIVTDRCNFSCRHCLRSADRTNDLDLDLAKRITREAARFHYHRVSLTGGEPLLYPHLPELLEDICAHDGFFSVVSNGFLFSKYLDIFKKLRRRMYFIAFSVESADPQQHDHVRQRGSYEKLLEAFSLCRREKIPFRMVTAVSTANFDQIFDIAMLGRKKGAQCLALTTVLPCPQADQNQYVLDAARRQELFLTSSSLSKITGIPVILGADIRTPNTLRMCAAMNMNEVTINARGEMVQCCELANFDNENVRCRSLVTSLKDKTFAQALDNLSDRLSTLERRRIKEFQDSKDTEHIDFNSCFYCVRGMSAGTSA